MAEIVHPGSNWGTHHRVRPQERAVQNHTNHPYQYYQ
jgi:hypothetical protein